MNIEKNIKIKESFLKTREKRKYQECRCFSIKIQENRLSKIQKEQLKMLFVEAKWLKNDILNYFENTKTLDYTLTKFIQKKNLDGTFEQKELKCLGSQMKQSVFSEILQNLKGLKSLRKNGKNTGKLKYCSEYKSINLKQFGVTYKIYNKNTIKIQGVSGKLHTNGLKQISERYEFANAKLLNTSKGYYLMITCYCNKEEKIPASDEQIGIDMGIKTTLTLSNGLVYNTSVQETERLKHLQKKMTKLKKNSKNRRKCIAKIQAEYQKLTNRKKDLTNKIFHDLNRYNKIVIQDENLNSWKNGLFGKQVQHSILGRLKAKIVEASKTNKRFVVISKKYKTTQLCSSCGKLNKMELKDRVYICSCGNRIDRDLNSAKNILKIGQELIEFKPVEKNISFSKKQEDAESLVQH